MIIMSRAEESEGELSNDVWTHGWTDGQRQRRNRESRETQAWQPFIHPSIHPSTPLVSLCPIQFTVYHYRVYTGNLTRTHAKNIRARSVYTRCKHGEPGEDTARTVQFRGSLSCSSLSLCFASRTWQNLNFQNYILYTSERIFFYQLQ